MHDDRHRRTNDNPRHASRFALVANSSPHLLWRLNINKTSLNLQNDRIVFLQLSNKSKSFAGPSSSATVVTAATEKTNMSALVIFSSSSSLATTGSDRKPNHWHRYSIGWHRRARHHRRRRYRDAHSCPRCAVGKSPLCPLPNTTTNRLCCRRNRRRNENDNKQPNNNDITTVNNKQSAYGRWLGKPSLTKLIDLRGRHLLCVRACVVDCLRERANEKEQCRTVIVNSEDCYMVG